MPVQVNEFVKRVRAAKIHCLIMGHLRKQMPAMMGKQKAQEKLLKDLATQFSHVQREHHLPAGMALCTSKHHTYRNHFHHMGRHFLQLSCNAINPTQGFLSSGRSMPHEHSSAPHCTLEGFTVPAN